MGWRDWLRRDSYDGEADGSDESDDTGDRDPRPYARLAAETAPIRTEDPETLRAARREARDSLDKTIDAIEEKDDKAISTVRLNLVLIGIAITGASYLPSSLQYANWFTIVGFCCLTVSTFIGMWAYTYTDYSPGVTADYIAELDKERYTEVEWLLWMNQRYQKWLRTATRSDSAEATQLGRTHLLQILGVALLIVGAVAGLYGMEPAPVVPTNETEVSTAGANEPINSANVTVDKQATGALETEVTRGGNHPDYPQDYYISTHYAFV
jgi:hypothetical protein